MYIGAPTLTGIVDRLERVGLVQRLREQDDRRKVLTGVLYKEDKPEYCEQYAKVIAKAQGA